MLDGMNKLVGNKLLSGFCGRFVLALPKDNILATGKRASAYLLGRLPGFPVRMHPDLAEIMTDTRFHKEFCLPVKVFAGRLKDFADNRGHRACRDQSFWLLLVRERGHRHRKLTWSISSRRGESQFQMLVGGHNAPSRRSIPSG